MSKLQSIFGPYATQLQALVDNNMARFAAPWYTGYFPFAPAQNTLTFQSVVGQARIEAAASVVNRDSTTPLRSRPKLDKITGEIPAIKEMFRMTESDYRDFLTMQALNTNDAVKKQQLLDLLFGDVKRVGDAAHKRLDYMVLEGISTGSITLDTNNNPDGIVGSVAIDQINNNKQVVGTLWSSDSTAKPLDDIQNVMEAGQDKGINFGKILMSRALFAKFCAAKSVKDAVKPYLMQGGQQPVTLVSVNAYLTASLMPVIELVNVPIGVEKNGVITTVRPFNDNNAVFVPEGPLGSIKNAISIEQLNPVEKVTYASVNRALISKWQDNEPWGEWTKVELNAFPSIDAADAIYILQTDQTS